MLVGDELKTAEGTQAFAVLAGLLLESKDVPSSERLIAETMLERRRVYQTFWDVEQRKVEGRL